MKRPVTPVFATENIVHYNITDPAHDKEARYDDIHHWVGRITNQAVREGGKPCIVKCGYGVENRFPCPLPEAVLRRETQNEKERPSDFAEYDDFQDRDDEP